MTLPDNFFTASQKLGGSPVFVQGGGGNLSFKDNDVMYVKASGHLLKNVTPGKGYVACRFRPLEDYLSQVDYKPRSTEQEREFNELIEKNVIPEESFGVPSIETGMHAILNRAAIHTHNIYVNVLGCMEKGEEVLSGLFPESLIVPYVNPGLALAHSLFLLKKERPLPPILFLMNHGLLIHTDTLEESLELSLEVSDTLEVYIKERGLPLFSVNEEVYDFEKHLFPDSVVYSSMDFSNLPPEKKKIMHEIGSASNYIVEATQKLGGKTRFFDPQDVHFIANMDREKHRMQMVREV